MSPTRHQTLQERIDQRRPLREALLGDFSHSVRRFAASQQFTGPSVYFHVKTIETWRGIRPPSTRSATTSSSTTCTPP